MPVRLRRTAVLVVVLTAVWLLPSPDDAAAVQHHHKVHNSSFAPAPDGCLAEAPHRCFAAQTHIRNPDSNDALDDVDDRDLGSDLKPTPSVDGDIAVSDRDTAPPWLHAGRAADPRATSLIVWRKLAAPRPPPSL